MYSLFVRSLFVACLCVKIAIAAEIKTPKVLDQRLKIELFAAEPDIVTPTGITVDKRGRVLCIESHTHFRPDGYTGPKTDRIRMFEDTDLDGRADRITTFFEGTTHTMNLAVCHDGSIYVATRNEIFRLRDTDDDGKADERTQIIKLDTKGNYPHNGLSGFAFDMFDHFYFGLGENLGASYKLIGTDGTTLEGGGEGGNIYRCKLDGSRLERIATGFWNPFHLCLDAFGRLFAVDNDPDWRPPCRLLHIVPGGDYGYKYRLGRHGIHPFTSWFGELPGTLGMVAGTGEAPSGIIAYESDFLPKDYRGDLIGTSWGIHAIERFQLKRKGASFESVAEPIVKGDRNFRPVGIALDPHGALYISDWVDRSYKLHGKGRIWRLSSDHGHRPKLSTTDPLFLIRQKHRPTREAAARRLAKSALKNPQILETEIKEILEHRQPQTRASMLEALVAAGVDSKHYRHMASDKSPDVRELAVRIMPDSVIDPVALSKPESNNAVRAAAIRRVTGKQNISALLEFFKDEDPFITQAARDVLADAAATNDLLKYARHDDANVRLNVAMVLRSGDEAKSRVVLSKLLDDEDVRVRFIAVKWVGEHKLKQFEQQLREELKSARMTAELFDAYLAAIDMLNDTSGQKFEDELPKIMAELINDDQVSPPVLALALRKLASVETRKFEAIGSDPISVARLAKLADHKDPRVRLEAVRSLRDKTGDHRNQALRLLATDKKAPIGLRAEAVMGLTPSDVNSLSALFGFLSHENSSLRNEAWRSMGHFDLLSKEYKRIAETYPKTAPLIARVYDKDWKASNRPKHEDTTAWMKFFVDGDAEAGERVFFHSQGARCFACHQVDGRGGAIGPDLSSAGRLSDQRLVESIVTPSREIAPRFVPWSIQKNDGTVFTGIFVSERGEEEIYADAKGKLIHINHSDMEVRQPSTKSIMPDGLVDQLTDQELRDLLAFLRSLR